MGTMADGIMAGPELMMWCRGLELRATDWMKASDAICQQRWAAGLLLVLLCCLLAPLAQAQGWSSASFERGYVLEGQASHHLDPQRGCDAEVIGRLDHQARLMPPAGGWPGSPQAVLVFNVFAGEVMIAHGKRVTCGLMSDARTRDSRFRSSVGQVVVPPAGNQDPIVVAWQSPLRPEWMPTIMLGGPSPLQQQDTARLLARTACMAITLALALSALLGWLASRDRMFLIYTAGCMVFFIWQALITGLYGYPYPWLPVGDWAGQWQAATSLSVTALMLAGLWLLCGGLQLVPGSGRVLGRLLQLFLLISLGAMLLPTAAFSMFAIAPQVVMTLGAVLVLGMALLAQLRGMRDGLLGWLGLVPFLMLVVGELLGSRWLVLYRIETMQLVATWLLLITAFAFNRRLGLLREQRDQMQRLADTDGLTGLPNRRVGLQRLAQLISQAGDRGLLSIGFVDVDHFKAINDTYGHDVGDKVLVEVARVMSDSVRRDDVVRMGGEEFLVMLPGVDLAAAQARMQAIGEQLAQIQLRSSAPGLLVTASIGVAQYHPGDVDLAALLRRADQAMYRAKQQGRNQVFAA